MTPAPPVATSRRASGAAPLASPRLGALTAVRLATLAALAAVVALAGCASSEAPPVVPAPPPAEPSEVARYMPLEDNHVYAYRTEDKVRGSSGALMLRVRRRAIGGAELLGGARTQRVLIDANGVRREPEGHYMLRTPIEVGTAWRNGPGANARITAVDRTVKVPAGSFHRCVVVVEERSGASVRGKISTTFCLDVGIVSIETEGEGGDNAESIHELVELRSFGPAVNLGAPPRP